MHELKSQFKKNSYYCSVNFSLITTKKFLKQQRWPSPILCFLIFPIDFRWSSREWLKNLIFYSFWRVKLWTKLKKVNIWSEEKSKYLFGSKVFPFYLEDWLPKSPDNSIFSRSQSRERTGISLHGILQFKLPDFKVHVLTVLKNEQGTSLRKISNRNWQKQSKSLWIFSHFQGNLTLFHLSHFME